jgi:hypothetical protein
MILRLSQKLCTKIKEGSLKAMPLDDNPFADWTAHLFVADRTQYIIVSNTKSLYSTVLLAKGITDDSHLIMRALGSLREFMEEDGQAFVYHRFVSPASASVRFAKALNRAVTGSMNELILHATAMLVEGKLSPFDVGFKLNEVLLSAIAPNARARYGKPREAFKDLVNGVKPDDAQ